MSEYLYVFSQLNYLYPYWAELNLELGWTNWKLFI